MTRTKQLPPLSAAQMEIMEIIWQHDELTVSQAQQELARLGRELARNTVQTLIVRMEEKGWLKHRTVGRTHFYKATRSESELMGSKAQTLLNDVFGGSLEGLVNSLLETRKLKKGEAQRIRKLIDQAEKNHRKS